MKSFNKTQSTEEGNGNLLQYSYLENPRDRREVGGGFGIGNTCTPVADSCRCMTKPVQYCKVKKKEKRKKSKAKNMTLEDEPPSWKVSSTLLGKSRE